MLPPRPLLLLLLALLAAAAVAAPIGAGGAGVERGDAPVRLPAVAAAGVQVDTVLLGGYARGAFTQALAELAPGLAAEERTLVGEHLERIFAGAGEPGLGRAGRLRLAAERARRPDGSTRSLRVLSAQLAAGGKLHTAYFFERAGRPGYYDAFGRSLDPRAWAEPLTAPGGLRVTSRFGLRRMHPILGRVLPHTGIDYAASSGTPVRATGDGVVVAAGRRGGYGNLVELRHPSGYSTRYAHLARIAPGLAGATPVRQGQVIGYVGATGLATGPHLHYEVRRHGHPVDPARVAVQTGLSADLGGEPGWAAARRALERLLASTPQL